jgi:membrane-bound serine protease (ClpP class)
MVFANLFADPNFVYLLLVLGLWATAFAVYTPGTGVSELAALIFLGGAGLALLSNPATNWPAVAVLAVGVLLYLMLPFYKKGRTALALLGLALQSGAAYFLFAERGADLWLIGLTLAASFALYQAVFLPMLSKLQEAPLVGNDDVSLPGSIGYAVTALNPSGTVNVHSEQWSAYSDEPLAAGTTIAVLRKEGLRLYVTAAKNKQMPNAKQSVNNDVWLEDLANKPKKGSPRD